MIKNSNFLKFLNSKYLISTLGLKTEFSVLLANLPLYTLSLLLYTIFNSHVEFMNFC